MFIPFQPFDPLSSLEIVREKLKHDRTLKRVDPENFEEGDGILKRQNFRGRVPELKQDN